MGKHECSRGAPGPRIRGADDVARLMQACMGDESWAGELVLALDWLTRPAGIAVRPTCTDNPTVDAMQLHLLAEEFAASELVLVTFVEPERLAPTPADVARFEGLRVECAEDDVELLDHVLMSGHRWRSIRELSAGPCA